MIVSPFRVENWLHNRLIDNLRDGTFTVVARRRWPLRPQVIVYDNVRGCEAGRVTYRSCDAYNMVECPSLHREEVQGFLNRIRLVMLDSCRAREAEVTPRMTPPFRATLDRENLERSYGID